VTTQRRAVKKQYDIRTWKADEQSYVIYRTVGLSFPKHYTNHRVPQILGGLVSVRRHAIHDGLTNTTKGDIVGVNKRLLFTARCYVTVTNVHATELTAVNIHTTQGEVGDAENARPENDGQRKLWVWKMQEWKMKDKNYGVWKMQYW